MDYKISTEIGSLLKYVSYEKAIEIVGKSGFDCFDLTLVHFAGFDWMHGKNYYNNEDPLMKNGYKKKLDELLAIAKKYNMTCNQAHAPFPSNLPNIDKYLIRAIKCASYAGAKCIVVHPINNFSAEENAAFYKRFEKYAKRYRIKICLENMWNYNIQTTLCDPAACSNEIDYKKHIDLLDSRYFGACVDVGHAAFATLNTSPSKIIEALGDRVVALHLHDNDLTHDIHRKPFTCKIDFNAICDSLKKINYVGDITLEADQFLQSEKATKEDLLPLFIELKESADRIREMMK